MRNVSITEAIAYYVIIVYKFFYADNNWKNHEIAAAATTFLFASLVSIPLGAQIVPFKKPNSIGLMMAKQLLGSFILAVGLVVLDHYCGYRDTTVNNLAEAATSEGETRLLIPFLPHYIEPTTPVSAAEATSSSTNPLQLASLNRGLYQSYQSVGRSSNTASCTV